MSRPPRQKWNYRGGLVAMVEALRTGDRRSFMKSVAEDPKLSMRRGPKGSTSFMYAVLYTDAAMLEQLLKKAQILTRAMMRKPPHSCGPHPIFRRRALLVHGADGNARSDDLRTPLMIASGHPGGAPIVKLLLDHAADLNPKAPSERQALLVEASDAGVRSSRQVRIGECTVRKKERVPTKSTP